MQSAKKKIIIIILFVFVVVVCFLGYRIYQKSDTYIKSTLEDVMSNVREAIITNDYTLLANSIDPAKSIEQKEFEEISKEEKTKDFLLDQMYPDLKNDTKFIHLKINGDWAGYYTETDLDDPNWMTVSVFVFHKVNRRWRVYPTGYGLTKARPDGKYVNTPINAWEGIDDIMNTINSDPEFQIENIIKTEDK